MVDSQKIGIDVTQRIEQHMATYPLPPGFQQHLARVPASERENVLWLAKFVPCAVEVAVEYKLGRGFILADRVGGPPRVWFVRRGDLEKAISRMTPETITAIQKLLDSYKPSREGVIVIMTMDFIQPIHLNAYGQMQSPGNFARIPFIKQEPIHYPGVTSKRVKTDAGVTYFYTHETLGDLGSISIEGFGVQSKFQVNVAKGNPEDPHDQERLEMFQRLVRELDQKFHAAFGKPVPDQTWLNDITDIMPLYTAFLAADTSLELDKLIRRLSPDQIQRIIHQAETSISLSSDHDAEAIRQRLEDLQRLLLMPQTFTESLVGLSRFVQAKTDEEARALLLAQADLLLSDAAAQEWDELLAPDEATQLHIDHRKKLWETIRDERQSRS